MSCYRYVVCLYYKRGVFCFSIHYHFGQWGRWGETLIMPAPSREQTSDLAGQLSGPASYPAGQIFVWPGEPCPARYWQAAACQALRNTVWILYVTRPVLHTHLKDCPIVAHVCGRLAV